MNRKQIILMVLTMVIALLTACGSNAEESSAIENQNEPIVFKLTHIESQNSDWQKTAEKFNEELSNLSNGRMTVETFPAGQLGPEADMVEQIIAGNTDFGIITNAYMGTRDAEALNAWFMPFLFSKIEDASKMRESDSAKQMLEELEKQGIKGMDYLFAGNHHVLMKNGGMISGPDDVTGKKIRVIGNPVVQDFWMRAGASPISLPLTEVYMALETGIVDGIHMSIDGTATSQFYEVADDLSLLSQISFPAIVMMSKVTYDSLSSEDQKIVEEAMKIAVDWGIEKVISSEEEYLNELEEKNVNIHTVDDLDSGFQEIRDAMYEEYSETNPLIKKFIEEVQE
ncbi:TRAP transporter substrate-binding protein [Halalkalibacterium ligniniphilum]|uniref:TRAP transporter substrate-binding protein n=1 Tax=Halalkalibacterium ligniniphilum TaxID=1134413 RepID=UPI0003473FE0|nr:TRAP transporter substrate-binding protein [Halalkalibacterium ligniniphilum]